MDKVLDVIGLKTNFYTEEGIVKAADDLSFHINEGECVALVGESGCGKSASAMSILRLIPYPPGVIEGGEIFFKGEDLLNVSEERIREVRGNEISMIFVVFGVEVGTKNRSKIEAQNEWPLGIDFWWILVGFGSQVGVENRAKSDQ